MQQKRYELVYLDTAKENLYTIAQTHLKLVGPLSARKITGRIKESLGNLPTTPYIGMVCRDERLAAAGYRFLVCGNYLCFYRFIGEVIYVYHIVDGRTDYVKLLPALPE